MARAGAPRWPSPSCSARSAPPTAASRRCPSCANCSTGRSSPSAPCATNWRRRGDGAGARTRRARTPVGGAGRRRRAARRADRDARPARLRAVLQHERRHQWHH
ncbi:hypothetical protein NKH77_37625 [Streptomyces sp. M19]